MKHPTMDELIRQKIQQLANNIAYNYKEVGEQWAMEQANSSTTLGWQSWNNALRLAETKLNVSLAQYDKQGSTP
jgi:hypothetical protein